jgi:acetolactate synthase-1/2/3 large subunit
VYFPQIEVVGDIAASMDSLAAVVGQRLAIDLSHFQRVRENVQLKIFADSDSETFPIKPQRVVSDVRHVMGYHDIIALDNGVYKIWFARNYPAFQPNTILLDNALATMGAGLPSAMMASMLYPERRVMAICGDGGFMMNSQELETAVRLNLNLIVLILNDSAFGMIRWKQAGAGFDDWGLEYKNPDFVKYAEAYGAHGHRVQSTEALFDILDGCYKAGGVHVVDVPVDYSDNVSRLITELADHNPIL